MHSAKQKAAGDTCRKKSFVFGEWEQDAQGAPVVFPVQRHAAAVRAEPDPEKRLVKVAVYSQGGFAMLRFEHYTETAPALDADGLPQGTDLKSVRTTVGQHGGSMTLHWENNWCTLRILFPLPKNE